jgi:cytochrome c553
MKKVTLALMLAGAASFAMADGASLYTKCAVCHGKSGEKAAFGKSKIIKNMSKEDIVNALEGYKKGTYGGPMKGTMKAQVAPLSDADIKALAEHISSFK